MKPKVNKLAASLDIALKKNSENLCSKEVCKSDKSQ